MRCRTATVMLGSVGDVSGLQATTSGPEPVVIESPYAGNIEQNVRYARLLMRDSLLRGEAPYASHLLYTQPGVLDDTVPGERDCGIHAGFAFRQLTGRSVIGLDLGISQGMQYGIAHAEALKHPVVYRAFLHGEDAPACAVLFGAGLDDAKHYVAMAVAENGAPVSSGVASRKVYTMYEAFDILRAVWFPNALGISLTSTYTLEHHG